jgi:hypothetical protein
MPYYTSEFNNERRNPCKPSGLRVVTMTFGRFAERMGFGQG